MLQDITGSIIMLSTDLMLKWDGTTKEWSSLSLEDIKKEAERVSCRVNAFHENMQNKVDYKLGFEDGEVRSYLRDNNRIVVKVKAWNEAELTLTFQDAIGMADYGVWSISELVDEDISSELMKRVLLETYDSPSSDHPYKLYQFLNLDGVVSFEVVAQSLDISG